jgi:DmsE family decaheme c-type cytochrome
MKRFRRVLAALAVFAGLAFAPNLWAAGNDLPDLGPSAQSKAAEAKAKLQRDAVCTRCHDENQAAPVLSLYQTKHGMRGDPRTPSCQSCHGESLAHIKGDAKSDVRPAVDVEFKKGGSYAQTDDRKRASQCLTCHQGGLRTHWDGAQHQNAGLACNDCHKVHRAQDPVLGRRTQTEVCFSCHKEQRADSHKISAHPIEVGKVICSDCHNPHGSAGPKLLKKNTVTETCFQCHAEKRGPFLFEHQPATEDCTNCHTPHGSNISPLLKSRPPFLCDECHDGPHNSKAPYAGVVGGIQNGLAGTATAPANPNSNAVGRGCMNCHSMVHGSNSPAGAFLHR